MKSFLLWGCEGGVILYSVSRKKSDVSFNIVYTEVERMDLGAC